MRDNGNFKELIKQLQDSIEKFNNAITSGLAAPERHEVLRSVIFESYLDIAQAQYSNGAANEIIAATISQCIPTFEVGFTYDEGFGDYDLIIWLLSLAILCDVSTEEFSRITAILKRDKANDQLISSLIRYKDPSWPLSSALPLQKHPYAKATKLNTAKDIKKYLDKTWYQGHSDAAWHDTHKNTKVNCYTGYWAWEVAALVKVKGIDDTTLNGQKYYPFDAVQW